ncbi:MAG: hypothetical protein ACREPJ_04835 [Rhodanobacteraceae bacterium]
MSLRVVATPIDADHYAIRIGGAAFGSDARRHTRRWNVRTERA